MERFILSVVVAVFVMVANTVGEDCKCVPDPEFSLGSMITFSTPITLCDVAQRMCEDCGKILEALKNRNPSVVIDPNTSIKGMKIRLPTRQELDALNDSGPTFSVSESMPLPTKRGLDSSVVPKAKKPVSRFWTKNFATDEYRTRYFMENYNLGVGENIFTVAKRYNRNPQVLVCFNWLKNPEALGAGQTIMIPDTNFRYWINYDAAPFRGNSLEEALFDCDLPDEVKNVMLPMLRDSQFVDDYIPSGKVLRQMYSAPFKVSGVKRPNVERNVVVISEKNVAFHARAMKVEYGDSLYVAIIPDKCLNFSIYVEYLPPSYTPSRDTIPEDTTPKDTTPDDWYFPPNRGTEPPLDTTPIFNRNILQSYGGRYYPIPYLSDGHDYLGARLALFIPPEDGAIFAWGFNLGFNGWDGFGPRDTLPQYRYVGIRPCGGLTFDWLTEKSRTTVFLDYAVQIDWGWDKNILSRRYHERQTTHIANLTFASIVALDPEWNKWLGGWVDLSFDLGNVNHVFRHKISDVGGVSQLRSQTVQHDKSNIGIGFYVFYWDVSTRKTSLVLGSGIKGAHRWEDNGYDSEIDEILDINHFFQIGVGFKNTSGCWNDELNGNSLVTYFNVSLFDIGKYHKK